MTSFKYQRPPLRVGLMGLGRTMFAEHYPIFREHSGLFRVVAACDTVKARRDLVEQDYPNCHMFRRFSEMLDTEELDLVVIATCTNDHVKHAIMSLRRGRWTLLETPMALTTDEAQILRGQALKSKNRLVVIQRGVFEPDFLLARQMMTDPRLGTIYQIRVRREDYVRRDDWQCVKRLGGGAAYYAMPDLIVQALRLLPTPPVQMWSELKRLASLGDAEDYARVCLKTRDMISADVEFNGGCLPSERGPSFEIRGSRGVFKVLPGATEGTLTMISPKFAFPRRRSSVRTPEFRDLHEEFPVQTVGVTLPRGSLYGRAAFWRHVYDAVRTAAPLPFLLDESIEAVKFAHLMKKTSPFGRG